MIRALLWKEYREYRWPALLCTPLLCVLDYFCRRNFSSGESEMLILLLQTIVLAVFIASNVIAGEEARGTSLSFYVLPAHRSVLTAAKVLVGLITLLLPLAVVLAFASYTPMRTFQVMSDYGPTPMTLLTSALGIYAWTLLFASGCRTRGGVLICGVLVLCFSFLAMVECSSLAYGKVLLTDRMIMSVSPVVALASAKQLQVLPNLALVRTAGLLFVLLCAWIKFFCRSPVGESSGFLAISRPAPTQLLTPLSARNMAFATFWKAYREIRSLALGAVTANIFFTIAIVSLNYIGERSTSGQDDWENLLRPALGAFSSMFWVATGSVLAISLGVRITDNVFRPKAADFWRSRPLHPLFYIESQVVAGAIAIGLGCLFFGTIAWSLARGTRVIEPVFLAAKVSFSIQFLMFPVTLFIGSIVRSSLSTAAISTALLVCFFMASLALADAHSGLFTLSAAGLSLFFYYLTFSFWRLQLRDSAPRVFQWA